MFARVSVLLLLAAGPSAVALLIATAVSPTGLFNDFHSYWYAGQLLAEGSSPYDLDALRALAARYGDAFMVGTGFSYPLPFAIAMLPFSALPFDVAVVLFDAISLAAYAGAVTAWLGRFHSVAPAGRMRWAALLAGVFPPVVGSVLNGQANLLVVALLAVGASLVLAPSSVRASSGGFLIGLAAVVKLVPGVAVVPLWLSGRRRVAAALVFGVFAPLALTAAAWPRVVLDSGRLAILFGPDPFVTNQSINGFVSRIVLGSDRMTAPAPGAFDPVPVVAILTALLAAATLAILARAGRERLASIDGLGLALALSLVAATAGAPKTSFWNLALVVVAVGLFLAAAAPDLATGRLDRAEQRLFAAWLAGTVLQPLAWLLPPQPAGPAAALAVILGSVSLYASIALWWLVGRRLVRLAGDGKGVPLTTGASGLSDAPGRSFPP
jgi:hypothetical protein